MVDKVGVKSYIKKTIGEEYVIPTLGVWNDFDEIEFDKLPNKFVLKCSHDSGSVIVCDDKSKFDISSARKIINRGLKRNLYLTGRELPYKNVEPKIVAEKFLKDSKLNELRDYKLFCFNGKVKLFKVDFDRFKDHHANYYDLDGNILPFGEKYCPPLYEKEIEIPKTFFKMVQLAEKLADGIAFVRIDFYDVDGKIYFGEMTFFSASGFGEFTSKNGMRN